MSEPSALTQASAAPADVWRTHVPAEPAGLPRIRAGVSGFARAHGAANELVADIALAVTEAATNAVVHAFVGLPTGRIAVTARAAQGAIVVQVVDDGRGMMPRTDSPGLGLGLPMMARLTSSCDIREAVGGRGTEVRMTFAAPGVQGPPPGPPAEEDDRLRLLAEISHLADEGGWPAHGVDRMIELLVPAVADAGTIDLIDGSGALNRIAARVADDDGGRLTAWLTGRRPRQDQIDAAVAAMRAGDWHVIPIDLDALDSIAHDEADAAPMVEIGSTWWLNLPLSSGDRLLGSLGLGFRTERGDPADQQAFLKALADRFARGLANTQLVGELRRTRRRLQRVLDGLAEAVTVSDEQGRMVYANAAAVELLGASSPAEVIGASAEQLMARFEVTRPDGSPVAVHELPGRRVMAGEAAEPLLTRSVERSTGRVRWLLIKATRLDDDGALSVNIVEDVTDVHEGR